MYLIPELKKMNLHNNPGRPFHLHHKQVVVAFVVVVVVAAVGPIHQVCVHMVCDQFYDVTVQVHVCVLNWLQHYGWPHVGYNDSVGRVLHV